jgi:hypothetical protein
MLEINAWHGLLYKKDIKSFFFAEAMITRNISLDVAVKFAFPHVGKYEGEFSHYGATPPPCSKIVRDAFAKRLPDQ